MNTIFENNYILKKIEIPNSLLSNLDVSENFIRREFRILQKYIYYAILWD